MRFLFILSILLALTSCDKSPQEKPKLAQVIYVQPQTYVEKATFYGIINARQSSPLVAQTDGILDWQSQAGDELTKEAPIASIENPEIARAFSLATNAEVIAKQQYKRSLTLANTNTASKQQLQEREQTWIIAQQGLAKAEQEHKKAKFVAPFNGIVGPKLVHEGTHVKTGEVIGHFFDPTDIVVEVQIPVGFKDSLKAKQTAIIEGAKYALPHVPKMLDPNTHMMIIHIPIQNSTSLIGEVIDVEIHLKEWIDAVVIPLAVVKFENTQASVLILKEGKLEKRELTLGPKDAKNVVVTNGLSIGESLCLDPHHFYEGDAITPKYPEL
jgi:RND family efflux transporter MFP subunit